MKSVLHMIVQNTNIGDHAVDRMTDGTQGANRVTGTSTKRARGSDHAVNRVRSTDAHDLEKDISGIAADLVVTADAASTQETDDTDALHPAMIDPLDQQVHHTVTENTVRNVHGDRGVDEAGQSLIYQLMISRSSAKQKLKTKLKKRRKKKNPSLRRKMHLKMTARS